MFGTTVLALSYGVICGLSAPVRDCRPQWCTLSPALTAVGKVLSFRGTVKASMAFEPGNSVLLRLTRKRGLGFLPGLETGRNERAPPTMYVSPAAQCYAGEPAKGDPDSFQLETGRNDRAPLIGAPYRLDSDVPVCYQYSLASQGHAIRAVFDGGVDVLIDPRPIGPEAPAPDRLAV